MLSKVLPDVGKVFRLEVVVDQPLDAVYSELVDNMEQMGDWNPSVEEVKVGNACGCTHTHAAPSGIGPRSHFVHRCRDVPAHSLGTRKLDFALSASCCRRSGSAAGALLPQEWVCSRLSAGNALHGRAAARAVVNFTVTGGETAQHPSGRDEFAIPQLVWNKRSTFPSQVLNSNVLWSGMKHVCAVFLTLSVKVFVRACV